MSKLSNYKGSVTLISGITQKNNGTFPLIEANAVLVDNDDTRLDALLDEIKTKHEQDSQALKDEIDRAKLAEEQNSADITNIKALIPTQASAANQLADKDFVNSSINAVAATFRGNFATKAALDAWQTANPGIAKKNDYAIVQQDETHSNQQWRYLYQDAWEAQYKVNDAPFTEAQNAAINSGATKDLIDSISTKLTAADILNSTGSTENKAISQKAATDAINAASTALNAHIDNKENPHEVTAAQIGLGQVNNTSDKDKPVSDAQKAALDTKLTIISEETPYAQAYVKSAAGEQSMTNIAVGNVANTIAIRDASGKLQVADGTATTDAVSKGQMDIALAGKADTSALTDKLDKVTGTTDFDQVYVKSASGDQTMVSINDLPGSRSIVIRDENGRAKFIAGVEDNDAVNVKQMNDAISAAEPYHIDLTSPAVTQDQYDKLNADLRSWFTYGGKIYRRVVSGGLQFNCEQNVTTFWAIINTDLSIAFGEAQLEQAGNKTTSITSSSTNAQYPSAKATYDYVSEGLATKYGADNPPPYPVTSVNGKTGDVVLDTVEDTKPTAVTNTITDNKLTTSITLSDSTSVTSTAVELPIPDVAKNNIIERVSALPETIDENTADFILVEA